ncbi:MAG: NAD(P)/FAD-dependent oxidoreductase [Methylocystis sp.]
MIIEQTKKPFCAVIGAGPAGLFAAEILARAGAEVRIYDHKPTPARKFLMAGRGGLNITHSEDLETFLKRYGSASDQLAQFIRNWPPKALRDFCADLGESTFIGSSGRVFPSSFKASPLLRAWLIRLRQLGVTFAMRHKFMGFSPEGMLQFKQGDGEDLHLAAEAVILALGGASWPKLGSDGAWTKLLERHGLSLAPMRAANCGALIEWSALFRQSNEAKPIKNVRVWCAGASGRGDLIITRRGLEGGPIYALSCRLWDQIEKTKQAQLMIDLRPDTSLASLTQRLAKRSPKQSYSTYLKRAGFHSPEIALLREIYARALPQEPASLAHLIKNLELKVIGLDDLTRAISTSGGVLFDEVNSELMLKKLPGVFVAGEMLDFDAPTGGYLLQAAFSTGFVAGRGAARYLGLQK